jgi:hypothetical protein
VALLKVDTRQTTGQSLQVLPLGLGRFALVLSLLKRVSVVQHGTAELSNSLVKRISRGEAIELSTSYRDETILNPVLGLSDLDLTPIYKGVNAPLCRSLHGGLILRDYLIHVQQTSAG